MRRLIACLGLLAFANLVFAQATGACALASDTAGAVASEPAAVDHAMHFAHGQSAGAAGEAVDESPATGETHTACPMMGQCVLTIDVNGASAGTGSLTDDDRVVAVSDRTPSSLTTAPELPPPRA